jgi:hypothetical protein
MLLFKSLFLISVLSLVSANISFQSLTSNLFPSLFQTNSEVENDYKTNPDYPSSTLELERFGSRYSDTNEDQDSHNHNNHKHNRGGWHRRFEAVREALKPAEVILESGSETGGKAIILSSSSSSSSSSSILLSCVGNSFSADDLVVLTSWPTIEGSKPIVLKCIDENTRALISNKNIPLISLGLFSLQDTQEEEKDNKGNVYSSSSSRNKVTLHAMLFSKIKQYSSRTNTFDSTKVYYTLSASARVSVGSILTTRQRNDSEDKEEELEKQNNIKHNRHSKKHNKQWRISKSHQEKDKEEEEEEEVDNSKVLSLSHRSLQVSANAQTNTSTTSKYTNPNCGQEGYPPCETLEEEQQDAVFQLMEGRVAMVIAVCGTVGIAYASQKYARED